MSCSGDISTLPRKQCLTAAAWPEHGALMSRIKATGIYMHMHACIQTTLAQCP